MFNYVDAEIKTVKELVCLTPEQLLKIRNFGVKVLNEVENILVSYNLHLGMVETSNEEAISNEELLNSLKKLMIKISSY